MVVKQSKAWEGANPIDPSIVASPNNAELEKQFCQARRYSCRPKWYKHSKRQHELLYECKCYLGIVKFRWPLIAKAIDVGLGLGLGLGYLQLMVMGVVKKKTNLKPIPKRIIN